MPKNEEHSSNRIGTFGDVLQGVIDATFRQMGLCEHLLVIKFL